MSPSLALYIPTNSLFCGAEKNGTVAEFNRTYSLTVVSAFHNIEFSISY